MAELLPCKPKIFKKGTLVFETHSLSSDEMEAWVKKVAKLSGQPVDWHYYGGIACVLALGNLDKVNAAIEQLMPEHDALKEKALGRV